MDCYEYRAEVGGSGIETPVQFRGLHFGAVAAVPG
jgi:hypothetical protein